MSASVLSAGAPVVLVTGGAGYIGSHVCVELVAAGFRPLIVDNFCNSKPSVLDRIAAISGYRPQVHRLDVNNKAELQAVFAEHNIAAVMHFAGLKAVGDSTRMPLTYYRDNVAGAMTLCEVMAEYSVDCIIFSSSATVYGEPVSVPIGETFARNPESPYGRSKLMVEQILEDVAQAPESRWKIGLLRYFNPVGAHPSGLIGEDPAGTPNNLVPYVAQVAIGKRKKLSVFGNDYATPDGTGVRDYIHVVDLALGHVAALKKLMATAPGCYAYNLGTGTGISVLEVIKAFEAASGKSIAYEFCPRRPGDIGAYYADPAFAEAELGWRAQFNLLQMMEHAWHWQANNPDGYPEN
ncbi:MAG TPA: UDP-glucose 4-epimerase GalE [Cellvibrionaceae bacterium]